MSSAARTVLVVIMVAVLTMGLVWAASRVVQGPEVTLKQDSPSTNAHPAGIKGAPLGTAGCLGAACHGAPAKDALGGTFGKDTWQSSGSCWVAADPHTAAYSLLTPNPHRKVRVTAEHIMERYAPGKKATEDARCLACHSNPALAEQDNSDPRVVSLRAEGVSCEACHGNAGGWLRQHTTWNGPRAKVYEETGLVKLYDVGERALTCAGCHIGAPADPDRKLAVRDMNHDMIAAGHPRLNFDFAEYQRRLPIHWWEGDRTGEKKEPRGPEFQVKAWLVGRVAHAEAACKLTENRAERSKADERSPWPEFAEFNCAACHHDLRVPTGGSKEGGSDWRNEKQVLNGRPGGVPPWQAIWPVTPAIGLTPQQPTGLFARAQNKHEAAVQDLIKAIQTPRLGSLKDVQPRAATAAGVLTKLRVELSGWPDAAFAEDARQARKGLKPVAGDLDSGLQVFFGLAAVQRSRPGAKVDPVFVAAAGAYRETRTTDGQLITDAQRWDKFRPALETLLGKPDKE